MQIPVIGGEAHPHLDSWGDSKRLRFDGPADNLLVTPELGHPFLGFLLLAELGRGTFGRVYLARQGELADRLVALKVSTETPGEARKLARLQHTNIVPVYSLHRSATLHAVCMPYLGPTTLADVLADLGRRDALPESGEGLVSTVAERTGRTMAALDVLPAAPRPRPDAGDEGLLKRLEGRTYVDAVLWIGASLADGLAHAHERGIVHRDLKPANVLLTNDGTPMLLDFNLADDREEAATGAEQVGGTLPYASPEQLASLLGTKKTEIDGRSDVYSLGVLLYELLTRRAPFPRRPGPLDVAVPEMIRDRHDEPPPMRQANPAVTPAVESILRRCLQPDPARRYQSAKELREDVERHLADLPLAHAPEPSASERARKWCRRHPRATSLTTVLAVAGVLLALAAAGLWARGERLARLDAAAEHAAFRDELRQARLLLAARPEDAEQRDEGRAVALRALARYPVTPADWRHDGSVTRLPDDERDALSDEAGELALLLAGTYAGDDAKRWNDVALARYGEERAPAALWTQRAEWHEKHTLQREADRLYQRAQRREPQAWERYLSAQQDVRRRAYPAAIATLRRVVADDPENFAAWYLLGNCCLEGLADGKGRPADASAHFSACVALRPRFFGAWYNRGVAHLRQGHFLDAEADFTQALRLRPTLGRAYALRALAREGLGQQEELPEKERKAHYRSALADLAEALERGESAIRVLLMRSRVRLALGDAAKAGEDRREALAQTPTDEEGWIARGVARVKDDVDGALDDFTEAVKRNPHSLVGWQNQAHVFAEKKGKTASAIEAMDRVLELHPEQAQALSSRAVLYARLGKKSEAMQDVKAALRRDGRNAAVLYQAANVAALLGDKDDAFRLLAKALRGGFGHDEVEKDVDLKKLRGDARYDALVKAVRTLRGL